MPNSCYLHLPMTHLQPTPTEPFPPQLQSDKSALPLRGRRGPAMAAPPFQALQGSSSALPFPWPSLGADLQTAQGWALPKHQQDEWERSKAEIKEGRRQNRAHPHPTLPASSQALVQLSPAQIRLSPHKQRFTHVAVSLHGHLCLCCLSPQLLHSFSLKSSILWIFPAAEATKEIYWAGLA